MIENLYDGSTYWYGAFQTINISAKTLTRVNTGTFRSPDPIKLTSDTIFYITNVNGYKY